MSRKEYNTNETSLERIYKYRNIEVLFFNYKTPDEIIEMMERIKKISSDKNYEDVIISSEVDEKFGEGPSKAYIAAQCVRLETDEEYRERIKRMLLILQRNKKLWEEKIDFYNGTGKGCWSDKVETYKKVLDSI